jgi:signal transduction histidine kinase
MKYNKPGGNISLKAVELTDHYEVSVSDDGIGMAPEVVVHLFEKFYRAKPTEDSISGTGLGLSICKTIIESHNGKISVQSKQGSGSKFTFQLPKKVIV